MAASELTPTLTLAERVGDLVRIPSVNPLQAGPTSGSDGEVAMTNWLAERASDLGADVTLDEVIDGRKNVYARFEGQSDRVVTIDVHLDTVGVEHMTDPAFDGRIENDRVYGRGSVDTKASLAIVLSVIEEMQAAGERPMPTLNVVGTVAEEMGGLAGAGGYRDWLDKHGSHIDQMIVAEPTNCAPVHGHKGGLGLDITVHGHAAHSSKPHLGQNAISAAGRIIAAIDAEEDRLSAQDAPTAVGNWHGRGARDPSAELIRTLGELAGTEPDVASYGSNALQYANVASEIVVFGPGSIDQAHQAVEWIDISEIERAAMIYRTWLRAG
ncbi:Acetylornithine deacetylase [Nymphon striatum]|nr:Acetylornithine deacetylase [Nymphon striatum]